MREKFHKFLVSAIVKQMKKLSNLRKIFLDVSLSPFSKISYLTNFLFNIDDKNFFLFSKILDKKYIFGLSIIFWRKFFSIFSCVKNFSQLIFDKIK